MAEFQEVMRQWVRVRKATASHFDEDNVLSVYPLELYDDAMIADIEKTVMKWAAEHPEPEYETWFEYLLRIGVIPENAPAGGVYQWIVESIKHKHIPADVAEALKIPPKEG